MFPVIVQFTIVNAFGLSESVYTPPPLTAVLLTIVQSVIVTRKSPTYRPPPFPVAELPLTVESVSVAEQWSRLRPPPIPPELPVMLEL